MFHQAEMALGAVIMQISNYLLVDIRMEITGSGRRVSFKGFLINGSSAYIYKIYSVTRTSARLHFTPITFDTHT